jgi:hypothetical protein
MHNKAHVRLRSQALAETQLTGARRTRTGVVTTRPSSPGQIVARWVPSADGRIEMRWEPRFAPPTLIARTRGEAAARRLCSGN